ncbi:hypothetical protein JOE65_002979 [Arthrobacter roseus]|nr:hypothetical protein [Arthrobacter roseus]
MALAERQSGEDMAEGGKPRDRRPRPAIRESPRRPGAIAHPSVVLQTYVTFQKVVGGYGAFDSRTRDAIALVGNVDECSYWQTALTMGAKAAGLGKDQTINIRTGGSIDLDSDLADLLELELRVPYLPNTGLYRRSAYSRSTTRHLGQKPPADKLQLPVTLKGSSRRSSTLAAGSSTERGLVSTSLESFSSIKGWCWVMFDQSFIAKAISRSAESPVDRRRFFRTAGLTGLGVSSAAMLATAAPTRAVTMDMGCPLIWSMGPAPPAVSREGMLCRSRPKPSSSMPRKSQQMRNHT